MSDLLNRALSITRESKFFEFKESFNVTSPGDWCEIIKDIIAMANTGGGIILIGVDNHGKPNGFHVTPILELDPADITNKINKYTGFQFSDFEILEGRKNSQEIAALKIQGVSIPIVFSKPGTYDVGGGKQKTAFSAGTVYFRHGAKSEPGNTEDIRRAIERQLESIRKDWIRGVRKVVAAPPGSQLQIVTGEVKESTSDEAMPIRIVDDPKAPAFRKVDLDVSHPYRMKELLGVLNQKLKGKVVLRAYDILCLRRLHNLDDNATFCHKPRFASMQYSDSLVEWLVQQLASDPSFFDRTRKECSEKKYELRLAGIHRGKNQR